MGLRDDLAVKHTVTDDGDPMIVTYALEEGPDSGSLFSGLTRGPRLCAGVRVPQPRLGHHYQEDRGQLRPLPAPRTPSSQAGR